MIMKLFPFLLGSALLLAGAARFWARADMVGAIITGLAAGFALLWPYIRDRRQRRKLKNEW